MKRQLGSNKLEFAITVMIFGVLATALLARGAARVLVTDGGHTAAEGRQGAGVIYMTPPQVLVTRVTGAGDTFMAAHLVAERSGLSRQAALDEALRAAATYVSGEIGS